jgi:adenylate cyclase class IV
MYEVEYKVEISLEEQEALFALFESRNFLKKDSVLQNDYYIYIKESEHGGHDLKRYRDEGGKYFYTEKTWEDINGTKARKEIEREASLGEFTKEINKYPNALKIQKMRQSYVGTYKDKKIHIDMDNVKFDHSSDMRYFIETEILVENKEDVKNTKEFLVGFLKEILNREDVLESPGMVAMALKKA